VDSEKRVNGIGFGEAFAIVIEHGDVGTENECRGWECVGVQRGFKDEKGTEIADEVWIRRGHVECLSILLTFRSMMRNGDDSRAVATISNS
jgi:hypothetical protein